MTEHEEDSVPPSQQPATGHIKGRNSQELNMQPAAGKEPEKTRSKWTGLNSRSHEGQ